MLGDVNKLFAFKSLLTMPSNVLPLHLKQTFPSMIHCRWKVFGLNPGYLLKSFQLYLAMLTLSRAQSWFFLFILCIQYTLHTLVFTADIYPPPTTIIMVRLHVLWIMIAIASISILQSLPQPSVQKSFSLQLTKVTTE